MAEGRKTGVHKLSKLHLVDARAARRLPRRAREVVDLNLKVNRGQGCPLLCSAARREVFLTTLYRHRCRLPNPALSMLCGQ